MVAAAASRARVTPGPPWRRNLRRRGGRAGRRCVCSGSSDGKVRHPDPLVVDVAGTAAAPPRTGPSGVSFRSPCEHRLPRRSSATPSTRATSLDGAGARWRFEVAGDDTHEVTVGTLVVYPTTTPRRGCPEWRRAGPPCPWLIHADAGVTASRLDPRGARLRLPQAQQPARCRQSRRY